MSDNFYHWVQSFMPLKHFLSIEQLDTSTLIQLLDKAQYFLDTAVLTQSILPNLTGRVVANLFFENSTRTRNSFEIAAKRLGALVLNPNIETSALSKGESLEDMVLNLEAMGVNLFVIRHSQNQIAESLIPLLQNQTHLVNAGDGAHQHPTQALLDLLTIRQHHADFSTLKVAIIGDLAHSRVANSLRQGLMLLGCNDIRLIAPNFLLPEHIDTHTHTQIQCFEDPEEGIKDVDIIYFLRLQKERMSAEKLQSSIDFSTKFMISQKHLSLAKPDVKIMHPGPVNRGIELSSEIIDGPNSLILSQVKNGVAARMAVLDFLLQEPNHF